MFYTILFYLLLTFAPPCEYEDGSGQAVCTWNATDQGNGLGNSFVTIGSVIYLYKGGPSF